MTRTTGQAFLLKISDGSTPPIYRTVAALRVTEMSIADEAIAISATGIFLGSAAEAGVRSNALTGTLDAYELSFEDGQKLHGQFLIQRLDYGGEFNGSRHYSITLASSGKVEVA